MRNYKGMVYDGEITTLEVFDRLWDDLREELILSDVKRDKIKALRVLVFDRINEVFESKRKEHDKLPEVLEANSLLHTKQIAILQAKVKALEELLAKEALK